MASRSGVRRSAKELASQLWLSESRQASLQSSLPYSFNGLLIVGNREVFRVLWRMCVRMSRYVPSGIRTNVILISKALYQKAS
jgi:hypothetical protein